MIIGQYMIESDDNNVTLYKSHIITKCKGGIQPKAANIGKDKWERIGYYSSLATALQGMVNHGIDDSGMKTVELLVAKMNELLAAINSVTGSAIARINVAPPVELNPMDDTAEGVNLAKNDAVDIRRPGRGRPKKVLTPEHIAKMQAGRKHAHAPTKA